MSWHIFDSRNPLSPIHPIGNGARVSMTTDAYHAEYSTCVVVARYSKMRIEYESTRQTLSTGILGHFGPSSANHSAERDQYCLGMRR